MRKLFKHMGVCCWKRKQRDVWQQKTGVKKKERELKSWWVPSCFFKQRTKTWDTKKRCLFCKSNRHRNSFLYKHCYKSDSLDSKKEDQLIAIIHRSIENVKLNTRNDVCLDFLKNKSYMSKKRTTIHRASRKNMADKDRQVRLEKKRNELV